MRMLYALVISSLFIAGTGWANDPVDPLRALGRSASESFADAATFGDPSAHRIRTPRTRSAGFTEGPSPRKADVVFYFDLATGVAHTRDILAVPEGLRVRASLRVPLTGARQSSVAPGSWVEARFENASEADLEAYDGRLPAFATSGPAASGSAVRDVRPLWTGCSDVYNYPVVTVNMYNDSEYIGTHTAYADQAWGGGCSTVASQYAYPNVEDAELHAYVGSTNQYYVHDFGWLLYWTPGMTINVFNVPNAPVTYPTPLTYVTFGMTFWCDRSGKGEPNLDFTTEISGYVMYE